MENTVTATAARLAALTAAAPSAFTASGLYVGHSAPTLTAAAAPTPVAPAKAPRKTPVSPFYADHTYTVWEDTAPSMRGRCRVCGRKVGAAVHTALAAPLCRPTGTHNAPALTYAYAGAAKVAAVSYAPRPSLDTPALAAPVAPVSSRAAAAVARARRAVNSAPPVSAALSLD